MPTTIGHALAGVAAAWGADLVPGPHVSRATAAPASWYRRAGNGLTLACVVLATVPDADLLFHVHRTWSHSVFAVLVAGVCAAVTAAARPRASLSVARIAATCAAAYATHLLLDWLAVDFAPPRGIQLFWPFSTAWYISDWSVFRQVDRRAFLSPPTMWVNAQAVAQEVALLAPVLVVIWSVRVKALARFPAEMSRRDHSAE